MFQKRVQLISGLQMAQELVAGERSLRLGLLFRVGYIRWLDGRQLSMGDGLNYKDF